MSLWWSWEGRPIGECWLQPMNMPEVLRRYPGRDVRRIDLMIGAKELWGRGWGTRVIALLTALAFERCGADAVVGLVGDYNPRSRRAFRKNGYVLDQIVPAGPGDDKAQATYELVLTREAYHRRARGGAQ